MLKLCFDDGNEYELVVINSSLFTVTSKEPHPNFTPVNIVSGNSGAGDYREYTYRAIRFNGEYYGAKLLNKE